MGALLNYLHHRQLSFDDKDESYPGVIARDSGGFPHKTQLNDALIAAEAILASFKPIDVGPVVLSLGNHSPAGSVPWK